MTRVVSLVVAILATMWASAALFSSQLEMLAGMTVAVAALTVSAVT